MNWSRLLAGAEYAYNNSRSSSTNTTPFRALYGYDSDLRIDIPSAEDSAIKGEAPAAYDRVTRLNDLRNSLKEQLLHSQEHQAKYYNQRHIPRLFKRGNLVKLSTKNLRLKDKKLQPRWIGPLRVLERIGAQAYRLALPTKYNRLHNVFPIQAIDEYKPRKDQLVLPMPDLEDNDEWEVEEVKDHTVIKGQDYYLVKWTGWPAEYNLWILATDIENAKEAIQRYSKAKKAKEVAKAKQNKR